MPRLTKSNVGRMYRGWLLSEAEKEAASGCALLKLLPDTLPAYFIEQTEGWSVVDVSALLHARIKLLRLDRTPPPELSDHERRLASHIEWPVLSPDAVSKTHVVWDVRRRFSSGEFRIDRKALRREIRARLDRHLGKANLVGGVVRYVTVLDSVAIYTDIDYPTRGTGQVRYSQCLVEKESAAGHDVGYADAGMLLNASVHNLLGVPLTEWSCITGAGVSEVPGILRMGP